MAKRGTPAGGISPDMRIVVLHGKEPYLIASASKRYEDLLREEFGNVARIEFDGQTVELATVLDELRSFALFEPHKLVIVDAADKFLARPVPRSSTISWVSSIADEGRPNLALPQSVWTAESKGGAPAIAALKSATAVAAPCG